MMFSARRVAEADSRAEALHILHLPLGERGGDEEVVAPQSAFTRFAYLATISPA